MSESQISEHASLERKEGILEKYFTKVTAFSNIISAVLFIILPVAGFVLGYDEGVKDTLTKLSPIEIVMKRHTEEAKIPTTPVMHELNLYKNTEFGFSFRYPSNYEIVSADRRGEEGREIIALQTQTLKDNPYYVVRVSDIIATSTIALMETFDAWKQYSVEAKELSIGGFDGVIVTNPNEHIAGGTTYYFIAQGVVIEISATEGSLEPNQVVQSLERVETQAEMLKRFLGI